MSNKNENINEIIKKSWKASQKTRFKNLSGYKFDRYIFRTCMYLCFLLLFFIAYSSSFDLDYFLCPEDSDGSISGPRVMLKGYIKENVNYGCKNPFYKDSWKNEPYLNPGEYGNKPSALFRNAGNFSLLIILFGFIINHLFYNRKYFKEQNKKLKW